MRLDVHLGPSPCTTPFSQSMVNGCTPCAPRRSSKTVTSSRRRTTCKQRYIQWWAARAFERTLCHKCHPTQAPHPTSSLQVFGACFFGQRTLVVIEGSVGRKQFVKYLARHPHHVGAWTQVCPLHSCAAPLSHLAHTLPHLLQPHSTRRAAPPHMPHRSVEHRPSAPPQPSSPPLDTGHAQRLGHLSRLHYKHQVHQRGCGRRGVHPWLFYLGGAPPVDRLRRFQCVRQGRSAGGDAAPCVLPQPDGCCRSVRDVASVG